MHKYEPTTRTYMYATATHTERKHYSWTTLTTHTRLGGRRHAKAHATKRPRQMSPSTDGSERRGPSKGGGTRAKEDRAIGSMSDGAPSNEGPSKGVPSDGVQG